MLFSHAMPRPEWKRIATYVYAVAAVIATIALLWYAIPQLVEAWKQYPWDGKVDWIAARAWWQGINPYSKAELIRVKLDGLGHPPTTSFWFLPFARWDMLQISPLVGHFIVFAMLTMFMMLSYELSWPLAPLTALLLFAAVMSSGFMYYHLYLVQVSGFIAFLYFLGWYLLRRGEEVTAGAMLGLACTFKLFPGLMVFMLLLARRFRAVAAACLAYLAVFTVMTSRFGLIAWPQYAESEKIITNYWIGNYRNASLYGVALRLLTPACHGATIAKPMATLISFAISALLLAVTLRLSWRALQTRRWDLVFALFATLSVFMNPFTFEHYFALLLLPTALAATALYRAQRLGMVWRDVLICAALLVAVVVMIFLPFRLLDNIPWALAHHQKHVIEVVNWLHMPLLMAAIAMLLYFENRKGGIKLLKQPG
jgi:hypothetical protein